MKTFTPNKVLHEMRKRVDETEKTLLNKKAAGRVT